MVAPVYSNYTNRKGIYKDLYREINSDNKKKMQEEEIAKARKSPKGIYVNLYKEIEESRNRIAFKDKRDREVLQISLFQSIQNSINWLLSKLSCFFSSAAGELKMLIVTLMVAKKPINSYIENNLSTSPSQSQNLGSNSGIYYNDR